MKSTHTSSSKSASSQNDENSPLFQTIFPRGLHMFNHTIGHPRPTIHPHNTHVSSVEWTIRYINTDRSSLQRMKESIRFHMSSNRTTHSFFKSAKYQTCSVIHNHTFTHSSYLHTLASHHPIRNTSSTYTFNVSSKMTLPSFRG